MNKKFKEEALNILKGKWLKVIGVFLLYSIISLLINEILDMFIKNYITKNESIVSFIELILYLITVPLYYGLLKYCIELNNNEHKLKILFKFYTNGKLVLKVIGAYLLQLIYITLKFILLIIPGIIALYEYALVEYIIIKEPEIKVSDAIKKSKEIMKKHKLELFSLQISFFGWYIAIALSLLSVSIIATLMLSPFGITGELQINILTAIVMIIIAAQFLVLYVYITMAKIQFFNLLYNRYNGIEEEGNTDKIQKNRKNNVAILALILIVLILIIGISSYIGNVIEVENYEKLNGEIDKIYDNLEEGTNVDMTIYCSGDYGELEKYMKNHYEELVERSQEYVSDTNDIGIDDILIPSVLDVDKPNMTTSKEKIAAVKATYENYYNDLNAILNVDDIKREIADINIDESKKTEYLKVMIRDSDYYVDYLVKDKKSILAMYNAYYNMVDFLAKNNGRWHAVGNQMYADDSIVSEYNKLYNKVGECENEYYNQ